MLLLLAVLMLMLIAVRLWVYRDGQDSILRMAPTRHNDLAEVADQLRTPADRRGRGADGGCRPGGAGVVDLAVPCGTADAVIVAYDAASDAVS